MSSSLPQKFRVRSHARGRETQEKVRIEFAGRTRTLACMNVCICMYGEVIDVRELHSDWGPYYLYL